MGKLTRKLVDIRETYHDTMKRFPKTMRLLAGKEDDKETSSQNTPDSRGDG